MINWEEYTKELFKKMGFADFGFDFDAEHRHGGVFLYEKDLIIKDNLSFFVENLNHFLQLVAQKNGTDKIYIDINNYRKEREKLLIELAKAAARKAVATNQEIPLPAMNSYERRIVHAELSARPDVKTESQGMGKGRFITIKPI